MQDYDVRRNSDKVVLGKTEIAGSWFSMIDVGLIGFGLSGRAFHAPVVRAVPGLRLAAILQRSGNEAAQLYPDVPIVRSIDELLARPEIRLLVIATPNDTHYSLARHCLEAGRDVVVDKPFTPTLKEALELVQLARERGRLLTVYQNRRYDGDFQAVRQIVGEGCLGRIVRFESNYDRFRPKLKPGAWRERSLAGAGIFFDLAPHLIDHALLLFGLPQALHADIRIEREHAVVDDSFDLTFYYPRDFRAVLRATMLAAATRPRFLVHGSNGAYVKQGFDVQEPKLRAGRIPWEETPTPAELEENSGVFTLASDVGTVIQRRIPPGPGDYRAYYANVRDALLGGAELAVSPQHALNVMRILELARESSKRGCLIPLSLPEVRVASEH
jgi:predicted dehydrogenase